MSADLQSNLIKQAAGRNKMSIKAINMSGLIVQVKLFFKAVDRLTKKLTAPAKNGIDVAILIPSWIESAGVNEA